MTSPRTTLRLAAGAAVAVLALTGCADGSTDASSSPSVSAVPSPTESTDPSASATTSPSASTSGEPSAAPSASPSETAAEPERLAIRASVKAGQVNTESDVVAVSPGQPVRIAVRTDVANELHIHGVEQTLPLEAKRKGVLELDIPADLAPGRYEVELHDGPILLFTLEVS